MSLPDLNAVIARALGEEPFRSLLREDPYGALEGYDLDPAEQGALVAASTDDLIALGAAEPDARRFGELWDISRGGGGG